MWRHSVLFVVLWAIYAQAQIHSPPLIVKQPPTDELLFQVAQHSKENDKPFIIECEAEGVPDPRYRWVKNGKPFEFTSYDNRISQQPGRGTLVITAPRDEDLGQYQCYAENIHGIATSNSVFVRKSELNSFKEDTVKNITAAEGKPLKLQCQPPDGWPKPTVHWLIKYTDGGIKSINNSRMTLDPEGNLWMSNVTRYDGSSQDGKEYFLYVCSATSQFRSEYKLGNAVLLEVVQTGISPAQNRHQPERQYVSRKNEVALRGKRVELFCIYGGTPLPQVVWSKNGGPVKWSERVSQGNYGKSLVIKTTLFEDEGEYTCEASNGVGSAKSYSINLKVNAIPYFTIEPKVTNAAEDETVTFRCEASGIPKPTINWIYNGKPIAEAPRNDRRIVSANSIIIRDLIKTDTANYGCNATNALGYVYKDVYLNVLSLAPEIKEAPKHEATVEHRNVTLTCRVFGAPKPEVQWIRNGLKLTGGRYSVTEDGDLDITDVSFGDAGDYECFAKNKLGNKTATGTLKVLARTRILDKPQNYETTAGNPVTFRCTAEGDDALPRTISWWKGDSEIDPKADSRFVISNDDSLTISKTIELDSGRYTCQAETEFDSDAASATLTVQDKPNPPQLKGIQCNAHDARISWEPRGDNRAPILYYTIQYNTSFTPNSWETPFEKVPATDFTYVVSMSPWANYTFRVIAWNKVGPSLPSGHSEVCTTQPKVPSKNPENVEGKGTEPDNLVIKWTAMPEIEHNAPGFMYKVQWQLDTPIDNFDMREIRNWTQTFLVLPNQQTFQRYRIKVTAANEKGDANVAPREVIGWSGEDRPLQAPGNFTVAQVTGPDSAVLQWDPVNETTVRGHFKGYKIETWTEEEGEQKLREIHVKGESNRALVTKFTPATKNYARILVYNGRYNGPPSNTISFETLEGKPGTVQSYEAYPLGSSAFWLTWKPPLQPNGVLTGYKIYYEKVIGTQLDTKEERKPQITDPRQTSTKLAGLEANTKYRLHIRATTKAGEGDDYFIEQKTLETGAVTPDIPAFTWDRMPSDLGLGKVKLNWKPSNDGRSGSHFYAKYKEKGSTTWLKTAPEVNEDFLVLGALERDTEYEVRVVAVDGKHETESLTELIDTSGIIDGPMIETVDEKMGTAGPLIGMILAALLILILCIICVIKRNRGGKYDVHDREVANGRRDFDDGGFHEYSQPLDNKSQGRQSTSSNLTKPGPESDTDSMAEYGEGDTAGQFTEDGSFIGQYVPGKIQPPISPQPIPHNPVQQSGNSAATYV